MTGEYLVRIRSQAGDSASVKLDGYEHWDVMAQLAGAPYTLSVNIGIAANPRRPHWQYLEDADPVPHLACER